MLDRVVDEDEVDGGPYEEDVSHQGKCLEDVSVVLFGVSDCVVVPGEELTQERDEDDRGESVGRLGG